QEIGTQNKSKGSLELMRMVASRRALTLPVNIRLFPQGAAEYDEPPDARYAIPIPEHRVSEHGAVLLQRECPLREHNFRFRYQSRRFCLRCPPQPVTECHAHKFLARVSRTPLCCSEVAVSAWLPPKMNWN